MAVTLNNPKLGQSTRFKKGQSGNPNGRPRKGKPLIASSYDALLDLTLPASMDGIDQVISAEQALQIKTYNQAMAGNRSAQRKILRMIEEREAYFAQKTNRLPKIKWLKDFCDPTNAYDALLLLDIASRDLESEAEAWRAPGGDPRRLWLEPWAVQLAINKRKVKRLRSASSPLPTRAIRDRESIIWPKGNAND